MDSASSIASSGMQAAVQRLNVAAYNIANATTEAPAADAPTDAANTFQPLRADQTDTPGGATAVTVRTALPTDAFDGVDIASEAIQVVTARYTFAANVAVMRSAAQMQKVLLDTFA
jgi:flagellar basal-body rod protein FlgC